MPVINKEIFTVPQTIVALWNFVAGFKVREATIATLPDATKSRGQIVFVTDATAGGGTQFRASDGIAWRNLG